MKRYWTHGDKTGASAAKNAEWKQKCDQQFDTLDPTNQYGVKEFICKNPFWKMSSRVPPRFEYISKAYRDYKYDPNETPDIEKLAFELFDSIAYPEKIDKIETIEPVKKDGTKNASILHKILNKLRILITENKLNKLDEQLAKLNIRQLKDVYSLSTRKDEVLLRPAIKVAIEYKELSGNIGGRKTNRLRRRNRKTRRIF